MKNHRLVVACARNRLFKTEHLLLVAIVAAGILLRIPGLLHAGLWRDEAYVYVDFLAPTFGTFLHRVIETEYHPPLYFLISYLWLRLAGTSELSLKTLPFVCSILTIVAVYRLGRLAGSSVIGLLAAAMYAMSPLAISESGDYLYPLMALLCTVLATLAIVGRRKALRPSRVVAIAIVTVLTMYTHYVALFYVPVLIAWALTSPRGMRHGVALSGALFVGVLPFLVWLPTFFRQPNAYVLKPPLTTSPLFVAPLTPLAKSEFFFRALVQSMPLWPEVLATVLCALLVAALIRVLLWRKINGDAMAMGSIYLIALAVATLAGRPNVRYVAPFEGLLCVFLAWVVTAWFEGQSAKQPAPRPRWPAVTTATLCAFILIEDIIFTAHSAKLPESGIRTFVMTQQLDPATLYVIAPDYTTATFAFYTRDTRVAYTAFPQTDHPEIYRYGADANLYRRGAVRKAIARLDGKAHTYRHLELIVEDTANWQNASGHLIYRSPVRQFVDAIRARYSFVAQAHYPGRLESVTIYRLATR